MPAGAGGCPLRTVWSKKKGGSEEPPFLNPSGLRWLESRPYAVAMDRPPPLWRADARKREAGNYIPEPWMPFQLASMAFTALSGSGT